LLTGFLLLAVGLIGLRTYLLWSEGPSSVPTTRKSEPLTVEVESDIQKMLPPTSTDAIINRNLFDPERGAGVTREAEVNSSAFQRIRNMVLLGTVILGNTKMAILQDSATQSSSPGAPVQPATPIRVKLGDTVDGFSLAEVADRRVIFTKGGSRVEVVLDYFRKGDLNESRVPVQGQVGAPNPVAPRVVPNLPRRGRLPGQPNANSDS
jgi:hypothetical protein